MPTSAEQESLVAVTTLFEKGMLQEALNLAMKQLEHEPDQGHLWELVGFIHRARQDCQSALHALETACTLVVLQPFGRFSLAECYTYIGKAGLACEMFASLLEWKKTPSELLSSIAAGFSKLGRFDLAVKTCRLAAHRQPNEAQPLYDLAYYMGRAGFHPRGIKALVCRAIQLAPDRLIYRVGLASFLYVHESLEAAYGVVDQLTFDDLATIQCRHCLDRLREIYQECDDLTRADFCRIQIAKLPPDHGSGFCIPD